MGRPPKPVDSLTGGHRNDELEGRQETEAAISSNEDLYSLPDELKGNKVAIKEWEHTVLCYRSMRAKPFTEVDRSTLKDYCLTCEKFAQTNALMEQALTELKMVQAKYDQAWKKDDLDKVSQLADTLLKVQNRWLRLVKQTDQTLVLLEKFRTALYLNPKSRQGFVMKTGEAEDVKDEMESLLKAVDNELEEHRVL